MLQCKNNTLNIQNIVANLYQRILSYYIQQTKKGKAFQCDINESCKKKKYKFYMYRVYLSFYLHARKQEHFLPLSPCLDPSQLQML